MNSLLFTSLKPMVVSLVDYHKKVLFFVSAPLVLQPALCVQVMQAKNR